MPQFIQFSPDFPAWSLFTFWTVLITIVISIGFTIVVFFGGLADLRFLIKSMDEEVADESEHASSAES